MRITRRHLTIAGALALGGVGLWRSSSAVAESADEAAVAQAVEALRKAVFGQEKPQLEALCAEQLSYGHSDGRVENKAQFINGVMTRKAILKSLTLSDHTIAIVDTAAVARHTWASESETDGKPTSTKIGVLQVWQKQGGDWKLLARQSVRPPQAQAS
jgi:ketosteroid isomerase-like protein